MSNLRAEMEAMRWVGEMDRGARTRLRAWLDAAIETELPTIESREEEEEEEPESPVEGIETEAGSDPGPDGGEQEEAEGGAERSLEWVLEKASEILARVDSGMEHAEVVYLVLRSIEPAPLEVIRRVVCRVRSRAVRHLESYLRGLVKANRIGYVAQGRRYVVIEPDALPRRSKG